MTGRMICRRSYRRLLALSVFLLFVPSTFGLTNNVSIHSGAFLYPTPIEVNWGSGSRTGTYGLILNQIEWKVLNSAHFYTSVSAGYSFSPQINEESSNYNLSTNLVYLSLGLGRSSVFTYSTFSYGLGISYLSYTYLPEFYKESISQTDQMFSPNLDAQLVTKISENISLLISSRLFYSEEYEKQISFSAYTPNQVFLRKGSFSNIISVGISYTLKPK